MNTQEIRNYIRELLEPHINVLGFDLVAVEWVSDGRGPILRLSIDSPGGVSVEDCSKVSHHASALLDEEDPIEGSYRLEVSSPGIDRPVQRLSDFARFKGYRVRVRLVEGHPRRRITGAILGVDGDEVLVDADGVEQRFHLDAVERAHLVLDLDAYQRLAEGLPSIDDSAFADADAPAHRPPEEKDE